MSSHSHSQDQHVFLNKEFDVSYMYFPPNYQGRWRVKVEVETKTKNGEKLKDCSLVYGDLVFD
jgi:hypothetical protein